MEFPVTIDSQEALDELIKPRLAREKTKLDDATARAAKAEADLAAIAQERDTLKATNADLQGKVDGFESDKQLTALRAQVAKDKGVPVDVLRGATKEELEAHADEIKPLIKARGPVLPNVGDTPDKTATGEEAEREAVRQLFGSGDE